MRFNTYVLLTLTIGCNVDYFKTFGFVKDSLGEGDIADIVQNILGNDTVLHSLLQRFPEFYAVVAQVVNQTTSNNTSIAIDEAYICNVASSAVNDTKDNCLAATDKIADSCFESPNQTKIANASIFNLCENTTWAINSTSSPALSKYRRAIAGVAHGDVAYAASKLTTAIPEHSTTEEIVTLDKQVAEIREESTVLPTFMSTTSSQNDWRNLSSASRTSFRTRVTPKAVLKPVTDTVPSVTGEAIDIVLPDLGIAQPAAGNIPSLVTAPPLIINPPVWLIHHSVTEVTSSYLFLAIKLAVKTAMVSFERRCNTRNGIYVKEKRLCIISQKTSHNGTRNHTIVPVQKFNRVDVKKLQILHISGNSASILATLFLLIEYCTCKRQFSLFDKSILSLALCILISHLMQLLVVFLSWNKTFCRASGILLHWALLSSFGWMTAISIDIFKTFRKTRRADRRSKRQYRRYVIFVASVSTTVILTCIFLGLPESDYSGHGYQGRCFIGKMWANLFSFTLPVAISLMLNTVLMAATLIAIYKLKRRSAKAFSGASGHNSSTRKEVVISILTLKLSILFGIGWSVGFVDSMIGTPISTFIFTGIVSLQGLFIFLCFGCHKGFAKECHKRLFRTVGSPNERLVVQKKIKRKNETETTYF